MSDPTAPKQPLPYIHPQYGLIFSVADQLIPLFNKGTIDQMLARQMAVCAIEAYEPETRADFVNAARTIAFSMAALALLGQATGADLSMREKMQAYGRANALNRSADQAERTMMQRRRYLAANPPLNRHSLVESSPPSPQLDPVPDEATVDAAVAEAMEAYLANCSPRKTDTEPAPAPETVTPVHRAGPIPPTTTRHSEARPNTRQHQTPPHNHALNSAIQRASAESAARHPA